MKRVNIIGREFKTYFKSIWVIVAPILLLPLIFYGQEGRCTYSILMMSCFWVFEVVPLAITSFLPLVILPVLGVMGIKQIAECYLTDANMLFVSSLMLSLAVQECQLHKRIALKMLTFVGAKPQCRKNLIAVAVKTEVNQFSRLLAGFMMITSFLSLWISDTACAALMAPIAYSLLEVIMIHKMRPVAMNGNGIVSQEQLAKR
ncbi:hypothetical protein GCK32_002103 [Trichostrongylus colubriformis]|uniref:Citrate transporter-like domain-containing protein n=1 Tax=Trichostrongylus colubriformis TaxID=6319 RepID=A0AAN8IR48_TRICO